MLTRRTLLAGSAAAAAVATIPMGVGELVAPTIPAYRVTWKPVAARSWLPSIKEIEDLIADLRWYELQARAPFERWDDDGGSVLTPATRKAEAA